MNYFSHLIRSKGVGQLGQRALTIGQRYGVTAAKMAQALEALAGVLEQYECQATFPITAVALARHPAPIRKLQEQGIEFAVHGWTHMDLGSYSLEKQIAHLARALDIFHRHGISVTGFRSPYLGHNGTIRQAARTLGLQYVSNQPILWDVVPASPEHDGRFQDYQHAIDFYAPWSPADCLSLPVWHEQIVEIPVSLPDDEMLVERLRATEGQITEAWTRILDQTYTRGEMFILQLHPERSLVCVSALERVLVLARSYAPPIWIARLDEIAEWWQQRSNLRVDVTNKDHCQYDIVIHGPAQARALVRFAEIVGESEAWGDNYRLMKPQRFSVLCCARPCIGVSARTDKSLVNCLIQHGYIVEIGEQHAGYSIYFDRPAPGEKGEKSLMEEIEAAEIPLIRISRWPNGARSALAITGDVDALTLWDYGLRLWGR